jgi:hypothetical protein
MLAWCNLSAALNANKLAYSFSVHRSAGLPLVVAAATLAFEGDFDDFSKWLVTNDRCRPAVSRSQREWTPARAASQNDEQSNFGCSYE